MDDGRNFKNKTAIFGR